MKITRDTVTRILAENGFSVGSNGDPRYDVIWLGNFHVGVMYDTLMYLAREPNGYEDLIEFNETYALSRIMGHINALKHPAETEIGKKRVNHIRQYFKERRDIEKTRYNLEKTRYDLSRGYPL